MGLGLRVSLKQNKSSLWKSTALVNVLECENSVDVFYYYRNMNLFQRARRLTNLTWKFQGV
jgi:hypothetical protein